MEEERKSNICICYVNTYFRITILVFRILEARRRRGKKRAKLRSGREGREKKRQEQEDGIKARSKGGGKAGRKRAITWCVTFRRRNSSSESNKQRKKRARKKEGTKERREGGLHFLRGWKEKGPCAKKGRRKGKGESQILLNCREGDLSPS